MFDKLRSSLKDRVDQFESRVQQHQGQTQQQPLHGPGNASASTGTAYWRPTFDPSIPVSQDWRHETGAHGWGNQELQDYTTSERNSFIAPSGGGVQQQQQQQQQHQHHLVLRAIVEPQSITSARLTSHATLGREKGYLMATIVAPSAKGVWPAFWLLPSEPFTWPHDGEVDIFETWDGSPVNHSCLHWGFFTGEDHDKHRVVDTHVDELTRPRGHRYGFAWDQPRGQAMWYIDDRPVMRANLPQGIRRISDFQVKLNIATGGNVMQGRRPENGEYEMHVHDIGFYESPPGGWESFEGQLGATAEGHAM